MHGIVPKNLGPLGLADFAEKRCAPNGLGLRKIAEITLPIVLPPRKRGPRRSRGALQPLDPRFRGERKLGVVEKP